LDPRPRQEHRTLSFVFPVKEIGMAGTKSTPPPPSRTAPDGPKRSDAPDAGEIEWAGGLIPTPPAPGDVRVDPDKKPGE
jgi:hypothetical protein